MKSNKHKKIKAKLKKKEKEKEKENNILKNDNKDNINDINDKILNLNINV